MSDKSIAERLQVKSARRLAVLGAPVAVASAIGSGIPRAELSAAEVVLLCVADRAALAAELAAVLEKIGQTAILWLAYPKLSGKFGGDLNRDVIHDLMPSYGLDTVSQISIDQDWSAMRMKRV